MNRIFLFTIWIVPHWGKPRKEDLVQILMVVRTLSVGPVLSSSAGIIKKTI